MLYKKNIQPFVYFTVGAFLLDQISKILIDRTLTPFNDPVNIIGSVLRFKLTYNPYGVFSIAYGPPIIYFVLSILGVIVLTLVSMGTKDRLNVIIFGIIVGGALGNIFDRIRLIYRGGLVSSKVVACHHAESDKDQENGCERQSAQMAATIVRLCGHVDGCERLRFHLRFLNVAVWRSGRSEKLQASRSHRVRVGKTIGSRLVQQPVYQFGESGWDIRIHFTNRPVRFVTYAGEDRQRSIGTKRRAARQHEVQHAAQAE